MSAWTARIICVVIGYAFGLFQTSYILGRLKGVDIRKEGSGNAGTTNAIRTLGKKFGILTAFGDVVKCILAVLVTWAIFHTAFEGITPLLRIYTAAGVILGHNFPFYLHFQGGKGIAASCGMIIAFLDWRLTIIGVICLFGGLILTTYMSVGSLALSGGFLIGIIISGQLGVYEMPQPLLTEMYIVVALLTLMAYVKHRGNIERLIHGEERHTYLLRKKKV